MALRTSGHLPVRLPICVLVHIITKTAIGEEDSYILPATPLQPQAAVQVFQALNALCSVYNHCCQSGAAAPSQLKQTILITEKKFLLCVYFLLFMTVMLVLLNKSTTFTTFSHNKLKSETNFPKHLGI